MPAKTLGGAIASAGQAVNRRVAGRLGRINDVHKAAVEGHYKAEAQQRGHEHHLATIDKVHGLAGSGKVRLSTNDGHGGSHSVEYSKGDAPAGKKSGSKKTKNPAEPVKPAEPDAQERKKAPVGRNNTSNNYTGSAGAAARMRAQADARKAAAGSVASPKSSTGVDAPRKTSSAGQGAYSRTQAGARMRARKASGGNTKVIDSKSPQEFMDKMDSDPKHFERNASKRFDEIAARRKSTGK